MDSRDSGRARVRMGGRSLLDSSQLKKDFQFIFLPSVLTGRSENILDWGESGSSATYDSIFLKDV